VNQEKRSKRELIKSIIETQEQERRELSVELHDNVNQMLASCKLMLEVAKENGINAKMLTEKTYQSIQTVIDEIRRISHDLNPSAIVDVGLVEAIEQLIEKINIAGKIKITFQPDKRQYKCHLNDEDKITIFRIVQEQLNNILKHANASFVFIGLEVIDQNVKLCIKDDGVGFDPLTCKKGLGLRNIHNRVEYYAGTIEIETSEGAGCEMRITLKTKQLQETAKLKIAESR
jgi:two-component system, NarL family, sensor histidine kinase UhpB